MDIDLKQMVLIGNALAEEKNIPPAIVHDIIEQAVAAAWRRDYGQRDQNVRATINVHKGYVDIYVIYDVVEEVSNDQTEISLADGRQLKANAKVGDQIEKHHSIKSLGRIAAQTAKQVILQKLREAERNVILKEFEDRVGTIMVATVIRADSRMVRLEIGQARALMPPNEQIPEEKYHIGQRLKVLLKVIERTGREPQLIVSRASPLFLEMLFQAEVPEINNGAVTIKGIAREAGTRSKVAVASNVTNVDPVGTFVGGHGARVKSVNNEVGDNEKIDIVVWAEDATDYIINSLNPTKIESVELIPASETEPARAKVIVNEDQLNVAIGRAGQNVRLAGRLTGYEIDINSPDKSAKKSGYNQNQPETGQQPYRLAKKEQLEESLLKTIKASNQKPAAGADPKS